MTAEAKEERVRPSDLEWIERIEKLSKLCAEGPSSTHIAFLGTSILAKAADPSVDLFAIKPRHARGNPRAYSARSLCHTVLVPLAAEMGINLGVTGREPLNNQPYFRMTRLNDGTPVHVGARPAFNYMVGLVSELQSMKSDEVRSALRAFIHVRRRYQRRYQMPTGEVSVTPEKLIDAIQQLVARRSEGGKLAQAIVAGTFDLVYGSDRVESGRINDPSRNFPGDVCVRSTGGGWDRAVEVRDKPVVTSDVYIFVQKCAGMGVRKACMVMASPQQERLDLKVLSKWAGEYGVSIKFFYGFRHFVRQALFWANTPTPDAAIEVVKKIASRLRAVEASADSVELWHLLTRSD